MRNPLGGKLCKSSIVVTIDFSFLVSALPGIHWAYAPASASFPYLSVPHREPQGALEANLFVEILLSWRKLSLTPTECRNFLCAKHLIVNIITILIEPKINGKIWIWVNHTCVIASLFYTFEVWASKFQIK